MRETVRYGRRVDLPALWRVAPSVQIGRAEEFHHSDLGGRYGRGVSVGEGSARTVTAQAAEIHQRAELCDYPDCGPQGQRGNRAGHTQPAVVFAAAVSEAVPRESRGGRGVVVAAGRESGDRLVARRGQRAGDLVRIYA